MGQWIANPSGTILSVTMLFEYGMQPKDLARSIENAVEQCLLAGVLSTDLVGSATTDQICEQVLSVLD